MVYDGIIEGKTVQLRSVEERDAEVTYRMRADPEKSIYFHAANGNVQDQLAYIKKQRMKQGDYLFIIEDKNGNAIGMKGLYDYDTEEGIIESGRFVGFGSQVQNIEALMLGFDFAFDYLNVRQIKMSALENNKVMLGIQNRFGAVFTSKNHLVGFKNDVLHSILTREAYVNSRPKVDALISRFVNRK
ncbi:GNAT family N-acetyltransferase [Blautia schinkii]|nr:GNAT family N-acetyltransferase [Blautia schinkii]